MLKQAIWAVMKAELKHGVVILIKEETKYGILAFATVLLLLRSQASTHTVLASKLVASIRKNQVELNDDTWSTALKLTSPLMVSNQSEPSSVLDSSQVSQLQLTRVSSKIFARSIEGVKTSSLSHSCMSVTIRSY